MQIIVTNVTRMHDGRVCVAGVDVQRKVHVRPVLRFGCLTRDCLAEAGGPFALGSIVDLGHTRHCGSPPEVEDHHFDLDCARRVGSLSEEKLGALLDALAVDDPRTIFGDVLHTPEGYPRSLVTDSGRGKASLGVWRLRTRPQLTLAYGAAKLDCSCSLGSKRFSVTDVRLFADDLMSVDEAAVTRTRFAIVASSHVLLCVGLGEDLGRRRAWTSPSTGCR